MSPFFRAVLLVQTRLRKCEVNNRRKNTPLKIVTGVANETVQDKFPRMLGLTRPAALAAVNHSVNYARPLFLCCALHECVFPTGQHSPKCQKLKMQIGSSVYPVSGSGTLPIPGDCKSAV